MAGTTVALGAGRVCAQRSMIVQAWAWVPEARNYILTIGVRFKECDSTARVNEVVDGTATREEKQPASNRLPCFVLLTANPTAYCGAKVLHCRCTIWQ